MTIRAAFLFPAAGPAPVRDLVRTGAPDTHHLSYRDEEVVLRSRQGELPHEIACALGHDLLDVMRALNRARLLGIPIRPHHAAPADRRISRTGSHAPGY